MNDPADQAAREEARRRRERARRLARVFGDVLPESTGDDRDERPPDSGRGEDTWLRDQVPPHHGQD